MTYFFTGDLEEDWYNSDMAGSNYRDNKHWASFWWPCSTVVGACSHWHQDSINPIHFIDIASPLSLIGCRLDNGCTQGLESHPFNAIFFLLTSWFIWNSVGFTEVVSFLRMTTHRKAPTPNELAPVLIETLVLIRVHSLSAAALILGLGLCSSSIT